jgi:hypothetical protein
MSRYSSAQGLKNTGSRLNDISPSLLRIFQGNPTQQITNNIRSFDYSGGGGGSFGMGSLKNSTMMSTAGLNMNGLGTSIN